MTSRARNELGFTLIELLIATAVLGVVTSQVFMVLNTQKRVYISNERVLDVQDDSRTVLDLLTFDTRMAGFMVPKIAAISSVDGGGIAADSFCISDVSYFDFPTGGAASQSLDNASEPFDTAAVTSFAGNNALNAATLDIDGANGANDFGVAGRGIILSDGARSHCARITGIVGNQIAFTPVLPGAGWIALNTRVVPAVIYEHNDMNALPPALPLSLTRNGLTLATGVEDLQIEYWVDNSPAGILNGVVDDAIGVPRRRPEQPTGWRDDGHLGDPSHPHQRHHAHRPDGGWGQPGVQHPASPGQREPQSGGDRQTSSNGVASGPACCRETSSSREQEPLAMQYLYETEKRDQAGIALFIAVVLMLLLSAIGLSALQSAGGEASASGRSARKLRTFFAADSGMTMVMQQLDTTISKAQYADGVILDDTTFMASPVWRIHRGPHRNRRQRGRPARHPYPRHRPRGRRPQREFPQQLCSGDLSRRRPCHRSSRRTRRAPSAARRE